MGHQIKFKDTKVLHRSENWQKRIIMESLEIALSSSLLNLEEGLWLNTAQLLLHGKMKDEVEAIDSAQQRSEGQRSIRFQAGAERKSELRMQSY